jgi:hypothetical protein
MDPVPAQFEGRSYAIKSISLDNLADYLARHELVAREWVTWENGRVLLLERKEWLSLKPPITAQTK